MCFQTEALGFAGLCDRLTELTAAGRSDEALAKVPDEFVGQVFFVRAPERHRRCLMTSANAAMCGSRMLM
jgi:hypothetical protein